MVLRSAERGFGRHGYANLSMRQIAKDCEMDLKNLQYYFPTKEDVLIGVIRESFDKAVMTMTDLRDAHTGKRRRVEAAEPFFFELWDVRGFGIWAQFYAMAANSRKLMRLKQEIFERFYELTADLLQREYPHATRVRALTTARMVTALIDGAILARTPSRSKLLDFRTLEKDIRRATNKLIHLELGCA